MRRACYAMIALVLVLTGCGRAPRPTVFTNSQTHSNDFDAVWSALIETFADNSWPIDTIEKASGLITTDWLSIPAGPLATRYEEAEALADCGTEGGLISVPQYAGKMKFNVFVKTVAAGTELRVTCTFQSIVGGMCLSKGIAEARIMQGVTSRLSGN